MRGTKTGVLTDLAPPEKINSKMDEVISSFDINKITEENFDKTFNTIWAEYETLGSDDNVAKGTEFVENIIKYYIKS